MRKREIRRKETNTRERKREREREERKGRKYEGHLR